MRVWRSGIVTTIQNPGINTTLDINEAGCLLPSSEIAVNGSTTICPGSSVSLTAPDGFSTYFWSNGDTTQSITASAAGNYSVVMTNLDECVSFSNTVKVTLIEETRPPSPPTATLRSAKAAAWLVTRFGRTKPQLVKWHVGRRWSASREPTPWPWTRGASPTSLLRCPRR